MCIAILSTAHPDYRLIIINNRDEFLHRPTSPADWWPSHPSVLSGRDLARPIQGTWLGITKQGRLAVLTNYLEATTEQAVGTYSRGEIVNKWLKESSDSQQSTKEFVEGIVASDTVNQIGGFNLLCGYVDGPLAVVSNRSDQDDDDKNEGNGSIQWLADRQGQTVALSNLSFADRSCAKVNQGRGMLDEAITEQIKRGENEEQLIARLMDLLSADTLPRLGDDADVHAYLPHLSKSIFIPKVGHNQEKSDSYLDGVYATQKQTVVLVGFDGRVRFVERTLYAEDAQPLPVGEQNRSFEFVVER